MSLCTLNFNAKYLGSKTDVNVLLPDPPRRDDMTPADYYRSGIKHKVIWLLHGAGGDHNDWLRAANAEEFVKKYNVAIVCPNGMASDYSDYTIFGGLYNWPRFLFEELMPMIYGTFPISDRKEDNFIAGFSMGGNGALALSLMHPELFGYVGVFSGSIRDVNDLRPYRDMSSDTFRVEGYDTTRFTGIYPPGYNAKVINMIAKFPTVGAFMDSLDNTWDRYLERQAAGKLPNIYVAVGSEDRCTMRVNQFKELAASAGDTNTIFTEIPGHKHSYDCARIALDSFLKLVL